MAMRAMAKSDKTNRLQPVSPRLMRVRAAGSGDIFANAISAARITPGASGSRYFPCLAWERLKKIIGKIVQQCQPRRQFAAPSPQRHECEGQQQAERKKIAPDG